MSVRGSTGSRRLKNQGQTAGHAGEEAESTGSGRGSHQRSTPPAPSAPTARLRSWWCREKLGGDCPGGLGEEPFEGEDGMALTPAEKSPAQRAPTSSTTLLAPGPLAAGSWTSTSWRQALLTTQSSLATGNGARVTEVTRGSS